MLYGVQVVQSVTAPTFLPVGWRVVGGVGFSDRVARRHRPSEIVRNGP
jgi:hypothetical protein